MVEATDMAALARIRSALGRRLPGLRQLYVRNLHWAGWWRNRHAIRHTRDNYERVLSRVKGRHSAGQPLKILILFPESSARWKCQSLYEALDRTSDFEVLVALTRMDVDCHLPTDEFQRRYERNRDFCVARGMKYVDAYSFEKECGIGLEAFSPDFVVYSMPWDMPDCQQPDVVSEFALTCYIPYYVVCHDGADMDSQRRFHTLLYRYFTTNKYWCKFFRKKSHGFPYAGEFVGLGHPMLDLFAEAGEEYGRSDLVIYAPHFSILNVAERYSTFLDNGEFMLEYAMNHPEVNWCFKPHPNLRRVLELDAKWPKEKIDNYYAAWEKIGVACYTGEYPELFMRSRALITDCSSFLMEYSAVNRPLIHLVRKDAGYKLAAPCRRLSNSFYKVNCIRALKRTLKDVVEDFHDPNKDKRKGAIEELNLWHVRCSDRIVAYLRSLVEL